MAEIIQFARVPSAMPDFEETVDFMKAIFGPDLGGYALVCWDRHGKETSVGYVSGPYEVEELPEVVVTALVEFMNDDEDPAGNDNNLIEVLVDTGIVRDEDPS